MSEIKIDTQQDPIDVKLKVITIIGDLDASTHEQADNKIISQIAEGAKIILDLRQLNYISSVGLVSIVKYHIKVTIRGGKIKVVKPCDTIYNNFDLTGMTRYLDIYESVEEAKAALK